MKTIYNNKESYKKALEVPLSKKNNSENKINKEINKKEDMFFIDDIFADDKFYNFRRFCRINKYKVLDDLNRDVIKQFESTKGVGVGKIDAILSKLKEIYLDREYVLNKFYHFNNVNISNANQEIIYVFWQDKYNKFKEFCKENSIKYIGQIDNNLLFKFKNIKGVGEGKVRDIVSILECYAVDNVNGNYEVFDVKDIYPFVKDLSLANLCNIFEIENNENNVLIKDIQGKNLEDIKNINKDNLKKLLRKINLLKSPNTIIENFQMSLDDRTKNILFLRYHKYKTLQDIANKYGITRERVRQIIFIAINNLKSMIIIENFVPSIKIYTGDINHINYDKFIKIVGKDKSHIINILIKEEIIKFNNIYC